MDEAELEAFLDGQLAERLDQETQEECICNHLQQESPENICNHLHMSRSKAEEALRTLSVLKQLLLNHMIRETPGRAEENTNQEECTRHSDQVQEEKHSESEKKHSDSEERHPDKEERHSDLSPDESLSMNPKNPSAPPEHPEESEGPEESAQSSQQEAQTNGEFPVLDLCAPEDGSAEDDVGIDMSKLLSSSSQTEGAGPNLSRQLMTHLRLLQQDLHYLKEVEARYRRLQQSLSDTTDSDDCTDSVI